ncbi:MAG: hypothetical protein U0Z75_04660 [Deinococcaceae bacterium]
MNIKPLFALLSVVSLISLNSAQAWGEHCYLTGDAYGGYEWICPPGDPTAPQPQDPSGPPPAYPDPKPEKPFEIEVP